jgi:hypothetical protein
VFDLDREVANWTAAVYAARCRPEAGVAELTDHLYCEIDRARGEGMSEEEAYHAAVARLGSVPELIAENAKNRSALGAVCEVVARAERSLTPEQRRLLNVHAFLWAVAMIAGSAIVKRAAVPDLSAWFLLTALLSLWWASDQLLRHALRRRVASGGT